MKTILLSAVAFAATICCLAQSNAGGISAAMLKEIRAGYEGNATDKAIRNALNVASINVLAANAENAAMIDTHFSDEVKTLSVTDQKQSGRCWLFSGLNVLRAAAIREHGLADDFQFSQNYCFFWDQLEKSNLFLQGIIDTRDKPLDDREVDWLFSHPLSDGGTFTGVADIIAKYGLVPADAMTESLSSNNTAQMSARLKTILRQDGMKLRSIRPKVKSAREREAFLESQKTAMLKEIYHVLALCLGVPPVSFEWDGHSLTPQQFRDMMVGTDLCSDYIMLMNDPSREYGKVYEIQYDRHLYDGHNWLYVNLSIERIKEMAIASIRGGEAMYFSCDVAKFLDRKKGVADLDNFDYESLLGVKYTMDKKERIESHESGSSHAMTLKAVDIRDGVPQKWMVENSWGKASGFKGNIIMTDKWFDEYMFRLVVNRKYVPEDILGLLAQKPILLPAWDPMFMDE